jgi:hypothetical protein
MRTRAGSNKRRGECVDNLERPDRIFHRFLHYLILFSVLAKGISFHRIPAEAMRKNGRSPAPELSESCEGQVS